MKPELGSQVLSVLFKDVECRDTPAILRKVGDGFAPLGSKASWALNDEVQTWTVLQKLKSLSEVEIKIKLAKTQGFVNTTLSNFVVFYCLFFLEQ